ncbi:MAG: 16S rRNA (adenine(1518)-N(6)/adenine(1519)-N(6))-dimethyltransferase RsmA [Bacteroidia bacterium]|nr:16S rRNA (adenine(1518)-N(6)/adenine(1519)-N(6))-dimethyltransferase RsmA [Bacteroidia bacterium]MDW8416618.1 16S rRNA (adenine(1518)-N(6)/adenine(1519)-N(6))-dimethyltransferase RsmA [Bacteroidia bacterium]
MPRYDQHFLRSEKFARQIADAVCPLPEETILEVGPGRGALTKYLLQKPHSYIGIEIDKRWIDELTSTYTAAHVQWIIGDFLTTPLPERPLYFVSNLPYSISGPALFRILEHHPWIRAGVVMLQAEVAQRLYAPEGKRPYGKLSVLFRSIFEVKRLLRLPPGAFSPPPKVWSEVVMFIRAPRISPQEWNSFAQVVKAAFRQPRQTVAKNLRESGYDVPQVLQSMRPHQLTIEEFIRLWMMLRS